MRMWYRKVEGDGEKQRIRMRSLRNKYSTVAHRISTLVLLFTISYVFASLFSIGKTVAWVSLTLRLATVANDWCCLHGQPHHSLGSRPNFGNPRNHHRPIWWANRFVHHSILTWTPDFSTTNWIFAFCYCQYRFEPPNFYPHNRRMSRIAHDQCDHIVYLEKLKFVKEICDQKSDVLRWHTRNYWLIECTIIGACTAARLACGCRNRQYNASAGTNPNDVFACQQRCDTQTGGLMLAYDVITIW